MSMPSPYLKPLYIFALILTLCCEALWAQNGPRIELSVFASGLSSPVDISHAGDDRLFVTERGGRIKIVFPDGNVSATPFLNIDPIVRSGGEQGLLGLAFSPNFAQNGEFYVNYTGNDRATYVSRFQLDSTNINQADPNSEEILLRVSQPYDNHNAGDMAFGPDGYLYVTMGDGGSGGDPENSGQTTNTYLGKILRLDVDGDSLYAIPMTNPFLGDTSVLDEIWSLGWRNPWRLSFDRGTGDMWVGDVGQNAWEEISFEPAGFGGGGNYGWRCYEGTHPYNLNNCGGVSGTIDPVFEYASIPNVGASITGGFVYRGSNFPGLQGHYIWADYMRSEFGTVYRNGNTWDTTYQGVLLGTKEVSTFGEDFEGEMYVAAIKEGIIYSISDLSTGLGDRLTDPISLAPNPMTESTVLDLPALGNQVYQVELTDIQGRVVRSYTSVPAGSLTIERGTLSTGIYTIRAKTGSQMLGGKLLIMD